MKDKNITGILALLFGGFGIHRFYLGQIGLGVIYLIFFWFPVVWLIAFIDAILFFVMDRKVFDMKYNRSFVDKQDLRRDQDHRRNAGQERRQYQEKPKQRTERDEEEMWRRRTRPQNARKQKPDPFQKSGVEKFKDYDFKGAIEDFKKSLGVRPNNAATHFNMACAYSMTEQADEAFFHLDKSIQLGFTEVEKIRTLDSLAFLRVQPEYDGFKANGFRLMGNQIEGAGAEREMDDLLLSKLKRLGDLRERGLISNDEFSKEKAKLLR